MQKISLASARLNSEYCNVDRRVMEILNEEIQESFLLNKRKTFQTRAKITKLFFHFL